MVAMATYLSHQIFVKKKKIFRSSPFFLIIFKARIKKKYQDDKKMFYTLSWEHIFFSKLL
jgi:hypothetical protein